jgi:LPXTG-site transpeptidase (sortase) family protein
MKTLKLLLRKFTPFILVISIFIALGLGIYMLNKESAFNREEEVKGESTVSPFEKTLEPIFSKPKRLVVESLKIDSIIESVGIEKDGSLETPKTWMSVGWYEKGAMPGQEGNLLLNAHYDDNYGRPAAFWQLKNINLGDKVVVVDAYGRRYGYKVVSYDLIGINDSSRLEVFKSDKSAKITLITCGGVWIPGKATYDKRLVIKGELIH